LCLGTDYKRQHNNQTTKAASILTPGLEVFPKLRLILWLPHCDWLVVLRGQLDLQGVSSCQWRRLTGHSLLIVFSVAHS
jgi:hypothetical protein